MTDRSSALLLRYLGGLGPAPAAGELPDDELVRQYADHSDRAAIAGLVPCDASRGSHCPKKTGRRA